MPPRSAKKAAGKKPSPKVKPSTPPQPAPVAAPVVEETADPPPAATEVTSPEPSIKVEVAEEVAALEAVPVEAEAEAVPAEAVPAEAIPAEAEAEAVPAEAVPAEAVPAEAVPAEAEAEAVPAEAEAVPVEAEAEAVPVVVEMEVAEDSAVVEEDPEPEEDPVEAVPVSEAAAESVMDTDVAVEAVKKAELETGERKVDHHGTGGGIGGTGGNEVTRGDNNGTVDEGNEDNEEDDPSIYMQPPLTERKKQKEFELFVGRLGKEVVEDELAKVFSVFGEIQSIRIVKHPSTQKSKGFGFVRYADIEHAKKALAEFKDGVEVAGKRATVSASQDNDTLYLGNICKTWTKDIVMDALKGFGVEQIEHIVLPDDPKNEGKIRGFAFLEFSSHSDAITAFQRLRKPDAVFGCDRSAKVAFSTSLHPCDEIMIEVKKVYVEGIPESWDEDKVTEVCNQYGVIETVELSRNFTRTQRKDFGFVVFTSHESAVACVEGLNNTQHGEGEAKVKANLAKPQNKGRLTKQNARGGFIVNKDGEVTEEAVQSKKEKNAKSKAVSNKRKTQSKLKNTKGNQPSNSRSKAQPSKSQGRTKQSKSGSQVAQTFNGNKRGARRGDSITNERAPKKARKNNDYGNNHGRPSNVYGNQRNSYSGIPQVNYSAHSTAYTSSYALPASSYLAHPYAGTSGSNRHRSDLEAHAGYIPAANRVHNSYGNDQRRAAVYAHQPSGGSGYAQAASVGQQSYPIYPSYPGHQAAYTYPSSGPYDPRRAYY